MADHESLRELRDAQAVAVLRGAVRTVGNALERVPGRVRTKLLVAFLAIAGLLVVLALLGLRVLGQSNARAERLGALQARVAGYQELEANAVAFRQLLALCAGGEDYAIWLNGGKPGKSTTPTCLRGIGEPVQTELALLGESTRLGFRPTPDEARNYRRIKGDYDRLKPTIAQLIASKYVSLPAHLRAETLAVDLELAARNLAEATAARAAALVRDNKASYASSRGLFVSVAGGAVLLALLLGFLLSWLVVGPIRRIRTSLARIAAGDFSGHVGVRNRDELGELGANVDRMNDELRRLYRELETASRHKSEFLANMSHELRTPLNAILGFSQVLREGLFGEVNEKQKEYLEDILSSGHHLLALINDVLDLSKVEAGQIELEPAPFSLREALERGVVMLKERALTNGVDLRLESGPEVDVVTGDERRIRQVVFNLLSNAVKFTPEGGRVVVSSARHNGELRIAVADTGPGIAREDQERIFEEFQQTDLGARQQEGTGLGLALSRRLIELHGGRIWVESEPGEGSTFVVALPAFDVRSVRSESP
ncbi:MAG TPA: HAMP domain-containing sensor histidine kinase [Gaiellaceae bacterium]|nr:HAMP domain-containing sensor histidine kinase [Gaiellaceae bacterium]